jgi:tripartite-type tricarboxylate transporter receptor subunit TctC
MQRTILLSLAVLLALAALAPGAWAQQFPAKAVRVITPFSAGSGPDSVLRLVADKLSKLWGQPVVVENRPGGSGIIAIAAANRAASDGYTLVELDDTHMALQPHLYADARYDGVRDLVPVATLLKTHFFIVVAANSPWRNVPDLVRAAKARPGELTYGSWFIGSPGHVGAAMLQAATETSMSHVPFKDMAQLYAAVANGDVAWAFGSAASAGPMVRAGKVQFLAVAAPKRVPAFPEVRTVVEAGGPRELEVKSWIALLAPRGTPKPIVTRINQDIAKVLAQPDLRQRLAAIGFEPLALSPDDIVAAIAVESRRYGDIVKRAKISLD